MLLDDATQERRNDAIARLGVLDRSGDPALTALTRVASYISGARAAAVHIVDDNVQRRIAATDGVPLVDHPREDSMCHLVVDSEQRIVCADATQDPRFGFSSFVQGDAPVRFYASVPLQTSEKIVIGTLCTFDTVEREMSEEQVARLQDLADQAVAQIELTRVAVTLGDLASHDGLTGAVNRLVLGDRLAQSFARRQRHGGETFLALLDVNDFKQVNDTYGHDAGDRVLISVADRLRHVMRTEDTIARIGGDEFVVLAELTTEDHVEGELLRRIEHGLLPPVDIGDQELSVGVSVSGVIAEPGESMRSLLGRADVAMYERKQHSKSAAQRHPRGRPSRSDGPRTQLGRQSPSRSVFSAPSKRSISSSMPVAASVIVSLG